MLSQHPTIINHLSALFPIENKQAQIAMSTVLLNYTIASTEKVTNEELQSTCLSLSLLFLQGMSDTEARFRNMVRIFSFQHLSKSTRCRTTELLATFMDKIKGQKLNLAYLKRKSPFIVYGDEKELVLE